MIGYGFLITQGLPNGGGIAALIVLRPREALQMLLTLGEVVLHSLVLGVERLVKREIVIAAVGTLIARKWYIVYLDSII